MGRDDEGRRSPMCRFWSVLLREDQIQQRGKRFVGEFDHFVVGAVLDRVRDKHHAGFESERFRLRLGGLHEFGARHEPAGDAASV